MCVLAVGDLPKCRGNTYFRSSSKKEKTYVLVMKTKLTNHCISSMMHPASIVSVYRQWEGVIEFSIYLNYFVESQRNKSFNEW